jgi:general stress protein YciG
MTDKQDTKEIAKLLGQRGGLKTKQKYGKKHYKEMSKKGLAKRWGKKK